MKQNLKRFNRERKLFFQVTVVLMNFGVVPGTRITGLSPAILNLNVAMETVTAMLIQWMRIIVVGQIGWTATTNVAHCTVQCCVL